MASFLVPPADRDAARACRLASRLAALVLLGSTWPAAGRAGDDGPELTRPASAATAAVPSAGPIVSTPTGPAAGRAVLAMPGMVGSGTARNVPSEENQISPGPGPSLDRPIEMTDAPTSAPSALEPDPLPDLIGRPGGARGPAPTSGRQADTTAGPVREGGRVVGDPEARGRSTPSPAAPPRRGRFFGLIPGPASRGGGRGIASDPAGRAEAVEPGDPPAESAARRRIEAQARGAVGDRARSVEVRVVGKSALIQARGVKFYQKRAVRKSLESIPAIAGLKTTIEVNE